VGVLVPSQAEIALRSAKVASLILTTGIIVISGAALQVFMLHIR
jgi:hypothetical protein